MQNEIKTAGYLPWQEPLLKQLVTLKKAQKLPHGLILQTDLASDLSQFLWQLASDLLCDDDTTELHCGQCQNCQLMASNNFPDVLWLTREWDEKKKKLNRDINIEQVRQLIHQLSLTNQYDTIKIAIIYAAEWMNQSAANSLLKTLEEPEPDTLILLATHRLGKIPITLRSRCQLFKIPQASVQQREQWLHQHGIDADILHLFTTQGIKDPVQIQQLIEQDFIEIQQQFEQRITRLLVQTQEQNLIALSADLAALPLPLLRLILHAYIDQLIRFNCSVFAKPLFVEAFKQADKSKAQALYRIKNRLQSQLMFEENNLNIQLQLNDVLLSLKTIYHG